MLDPQVSPEEIKSREVEGSENWTSFAVDIILVTLLRKAVETAIAWHASCCTMAKGHRLNTAIVLAVVHSLLGLLGQYTRLSLHSFAPFPPPPPPPTRHVPIHNKPSRLCGRKAKCLLLVLNGTEGHGLPCSVCPNPSPSMCVLAYKACMGGESFGRDLRS